MPNANQQSRTYAAAHFGLELDGKSDVGLFRSIQGGSIKTEVMSYQNGPNYDRWRQLGKPTFEDIQVEVGMSMSKPFYTWIESFFSGKAERKNGAIVAADFYYNERARREFTAAMIKELQFPKLDAADKNAAYMKLAITPEEMVFKKGGGQKLPQPAGFNAQKLWTACNFRFRIDGFEQACKRVTKIDSFTVKQKIVDYHCGGQRHALRTPSAIEFPQITFYVPEADAQPFLEHYTKRGIKGEVPGRRTGMIQTLDNDLRNLFTLSFSGVDIASVTPEKSEAQSEEVKTVKIEIYTESMKFEYAAMQVE